MAEEVFNRLLDEDAMHFMVVTRDLGMNRPPRKIQIRHNVIRATRLDGDQFMLNLYDPVADDSLNSLEREVASFLDEQSKLYFWYRNVPHYGYYVQGWQKPRIYADFVFTAHPKDKTDYRKVWWSQWVVATLGRTPKSLNSKG